MRADYLIPEENVAQLEELLAGLNKVTKKLGLDPVRVVSMTPEKTTTYFATKLARQLGIESVRQWFRVEIVGETPKLSGWAFVAKLDHTEAGNMLRAVPGETLPEWARTVESKCDHCGVNRARNATFVVRHDDGRLAQVGSSCLSDFLGHEDPHAIAKLAELLHAFDRAIVGLGDEEESFGGGWKPAVFTLREFLISTAVMIRVDGWKSRGSAREFGGYSTSDAALTYLDPFSKSDREWARKIGEPTDADVAAADAALAWATAEFVESGRSLSDFEHNVAVVVKLGRVERKTAGIAAAILPCHARALDKLATREKTENVPSEYVGTPGERVELPVEIVAQIPVESDFGFSLLVKMTDESGNVLSTFYSGSKPVPPVGAKSTLRATVKRHEEYRGTKQTNVSRAVWK